VTRALKRVMYGVAGEEGEWRVGGGGQRDEGEWDEERRLVEVRRVREIGYSCQEKKQKRRGGKSDGTAAAW